MSKLSGNYRKNSKFRLNFTDIWRNNFKGIQRGILFALKFLMVSLIFEDTLGNN